MANVYVTEIDAPCLSCGYNLRGLSVDRVCPECGLPTLKSVTQAVAARIPRNRSFTADEAYAANCDIFAPAASVARLPVDALLFILDAVRFGTEEKHLNAHVNAQALCDAVREYALDYFGDAEEAVAVLRDWSMHGSTEIARATFALVDAGLLIASNGDTIDDFAGLMEIEQWL